MLITINFGTKCQLAKAFIKNLKAKLFYDDVHGTFFVRVSEESSNSIEFARLFAGLYQEHQAYKRCSYEDFELTGDTPANSVNYEDLGNYLRSL